MSDTTGWAAARADRARSFGAVAADYAAWRPGYPSDVVAFLAGGAAGHDRPRRILDLGAGTGLLTAMLVGAGHRVVAADVSADMLAELTARLPDVPTLVAGAESLPLPDAGLDVIVAAQAAHWFEPVAASREFLRVLAPGGAVGFVWNTQEATAPWTAELAGLLGENTRDQTGDRPEGNRAIVDAFATQLDAAVEVHHSRWAHRVPPAAVVGRAASSSRVGLMDDAAREAYLDRIRDLLDGHPDTRGRDELELDYVTTAWRLVPRR
jgi:SAM-dependent methyltransferase